MQQLPPQSELSAACPRPTHAPLHGPVSVYQAVSLHSDRALG